jgi:hypothetical protein
MNRPWAVGGLAACVRPEPIMTLPRTAADVLTEQVVFEVESLERMYLNVYVPELQRVGQVLGFLTRHRGFEIAPTALVAPMSKDFVDGIGRYALAHGIRSYNTDADHQVSVVAELTAEQRNPPTPPRRTGGSAHRSPATTPRNARRGSHPKLGTTSGFLRPAASVGSMRKREQRGSRMQVRTIDTRSCSRW